MAELTRYGIIGNKNAREIVLLRGRGCAWRRCRFCDYHLDGGADERQNYSCNRQVLAQVTGRFGVLEVINSGSVVDLDEKTLAEIESVCRTRGIRRLHAECHWLHRADIASLRARFEAAGITLIVKTGVETFDALFRESYLCKGIDTDDPADIARYFDECCLLFGLPGQTAASMRRDIETGLRYFQRVCVNIMQQNSGPIRPDPGVVRLFTEALLPAYADHPRVDILMKNTDFGVGEF